MRTFKQFLTGTGKFTAIEKVMIDRLLARRPELKKVVKGDIKNVESYFEDSDLIPQPKLNAKGAIELPVSHPSFRLYVPTDERSMQFIGGPKFGGVEGNKAKYTVNRLIQIWENAIFTKKIPLILVGLGKKWCVTVDKTGKIDTYDSEDHPYTVPLIKLQKEINKSKQKIAQIISKYVPDFEALQRLYVEIATAAENGTNIDIMNKKFDPYFDYAEKIWNAPKSDRKRLQTALEKGEGEDELYSGNYHNFSDVVGW